MSTLAPALVAIGGVEEVALATWGTRILHVLRRGSDLFLHYEGDPVSQQMFLPTSIAPKQRVACVVLDDDLMLAWSERGSIKFMAWSLLFRRVVTEPFTVTDGESPALEVFRTRKMTLAYTLNNNNYRRNSSSRGLSWGIQVLEDQGLGPLRELDVTVRTRDGVQAQWAETDAVIVPPFLHRYTMDDADIAGTVLDDLGNIQNGTLVGGVTTVPGAEGEALSFDGVDDQVNLDGVSLSTASSYTIMALVRWTAFPGTQKAIWDSRAAANQQPAALLIGPNGVTCEIGVQAGILHSGILVPPLAQYTNRWNRIVVVYNASRRTMEGYLDGKQQTLRGVSSANVASSVFRLGASPTLAGMLFTGLIDTVQIWNVALTSRQVAAL